MSDNCATSFKSVVDIANKHIKKLLGDRGDPLVGKILNEMSSKLEKDIDMFTHYSKHDSPEMLDKVKRMVQQHIDDALTSYAAIKDVQSTVTKQMKGSSTIDDVKSSFQALLEKISRRAQKSDQAFDNIVDQQIEKTIVKAPTADVRQIKTSLQLFKSLYSKGDIALEKHLKKRGFSPDEIEDILLKAKKDGHIADSELLNKLPELNLVVKTVAETEKVIQEHLAKVKPGYLWRKGHAFSLDFDGHIVTAMKPAKFLNSLYTKNGEFIFKLDKFPRLKKQLTDALPEDIKQIEKEFGERLYKDLSDTKAGDTLRSKNRSNTSMFNSRDLEFSSIEAELAFYKTFKTKRGGLFRGALDHNKQQLKQLELRNHLGSDRQTWLSQAKSSYIEHFRGLNKDAKFFETFDKKWGDIERDFNAVMGSSDPMTQASGELYLAAQMAIRAVQTPFSGLRNILNDNTVVPAMVAQTYGISSGKVNGPIVGAVERFITLIGAVGRNLVYREPMKKMNKLMNDSLIASELTQHGAWMKVFSPTGSVFHDYKTQKGFSSAIKQMAEYAASTVSKLTLADATFTAARQKEFLNASRMFDLADDTFEFRRALQDYGMDIDMFKALRGAGEFIDHNGLKIPQFRTFLDGADESVLKKFAIAGETIDRTKSRLSDKMYDIFVQLHDDLAVRTTQRTGMSVHVGSESEFTKMTFGFLLKYMGITSTQHTAMIRGMKRLTKEQNMNTGKWNIAPLDPRRYGNILRNPKAAYVATAMMGGIYGGGYAIEAFKAVSKGQPLPDPFDPDTVLKSLSNTMPIGIYMSVINNMQYGDSLISLPFERQLSLGKRAGEAALEGDTDKLKRVGVDLIPETIPLSRLFLSNGSALSNHMKEATGISGRRAVRRADQRRKEKYGELTDNEFIMKLFDFIEDNR